MHWKVFWVTQLTSVTWLRTATHHSQTTYKPASPPVASSWQLSARTLSCRSPALPNARHRSVIPQPSPKWCLWRKDCDPKHCQRSLSGSMLSSYSPNHQLIGQLGSNAVQLQWTRQQDQWTTTTPWATLLPRNESTNTFIHTQLRHLQRCRVPRRGDLGKEEVVDEGGYSTIQIQRQ